jgi:hypothetical protein
MIDPAPDNNAPTHAAGIASDVVALLSELVAVDSVNPSLVLGGALLLCGHLDTVGAGGMTAPFVPVVDGDRLYGRGAYDMKAGLAAALVAAREANRLRLPGQVIVAAVADEEYSSLGASEILDRVHVDAAVVTEPTELEVATAHRGFVWTEIEVIGLAAHGSRPHLGRDAILKTGPLLVAVSELNDRLRGRVHATLGNGFVHASLIHGVRPLGDGGSRRLTHRAHDVAGGRSRTRPARCRGGAELLGRLGTAHGRRHPDRAVRAAGRRCTRRRRMGKPAWDRGLHENPDPRRAGLLPMSERSRREVGEQARIQSPT